VPRRRAAVILSTCVRFHQAGRYATTTSAHYLHSSKALHIPAGSYRAIRGEQPYSGTFGTYLAHYIPTYRVFRLYLPCLPRYKRRRIGCSHLPLPHGYAVTRIYRPHSPARDTYSHTGRLHPAFTWGSPPFPIPISCTHTPPAHTLSHHHLVACLLYISALIHVPPLWHSPPWQLFSYHFATFVVTLFTHICYITHSTHLILFIYTHTHVHAPHCYGLHTFTFWFVTHTLFVTFGFDLKLLFDLGICCTFL